MSASGLYGIRKNGIDKCTYSHSDSYPDWLGRNMLKFCITNGIEMLSRLFDNIEMVSENSTPTEEQIRICNELEYAAFNLDSRCEKDWYYLLKNLQGNFDAYTKSIEENNKVFMTDDIQFIKDSLYCEYAYIINIDDGVFEFYEGFQKVPQNGNRYGIEPNENGYYPCKLSFTIPLDEVSFYNIDRIVEKMEDGEYGLD